MQDTNIHTGVYEQIINHLFKLKLNEVDAGRFYIGKKLIAKDDAVNILSKYLQHLIEVAFAGTPDDQDADKYTDFVNSVIKTLGREFNVDDTELDLIDAQKSILTAVVDRTNCEYPDIEQHLKAITPITSLSRSALFFGGRGPADMESELNREILCADEICWVVSFIKTSGLNLLWNSLRKFASEGKKLRVITTTYTGATDYDAIARLASLPNTEIKISYDGTQDRLHAKSYIFLRNSGFHTAYIGSSNLSLYALKDGKEWNFKATQFELPQVIDEVRNSFEAYWCDSTFEDFIPGISDERLKKALGADWETQNRVREGSREAEAYRNGENNMLLFVRQQVEHPDYDCRMGFTYLGQVTMKSIEGSKPMQIVWHLNTPMSEATYAFASQYKAIG